jgi:hypothetical protein
MERDSIIMNSANSKVVLDRQPTDLWMLSKTIFPTF